MLSRFYSLISLLFVVVLLWALVGFKATILVLVLAALWCAYLLDEDTRRTALLPVYLRGVVKQVKETFQSTKVNLRAFIYESRYQKPNKNMFDNWNPFQWIWKGGEKQKARSITRSRFARRPSTSKDSGRSRPKTKEIDTSFNSSTSVFKSTPKSPRKTYNANRSADDSSANVSILNASGPLISTPMMPMIKRAVANNSTLNDTLSPDLASPGSFRSRPVRRANTFHVAPSYPTDTSPGVLPWVRFGRRDRHSLYKGDMESFKRHNTVRVAPPDPHKLASPSMMPLRERYDNTPKTVDTQAVVNALRERRKRSLVLANDDETVYEEPGQHAKRRRQESSQSTASSASLPPMPDHLPDLSDTSVMMQLDQASLKRPSAPSREALDDSDLDGNQSKRQKNNRNNPITSSLSSSRKMVIRERLEAKRKASATPVDGEMTSSKRLAAEPPTPEIQQEDGSLMYNSMVEEAEAEDAQTTNTTDGTKTSTPSHGKPSLNKSLTVDGMSKPTRRRTIALYPSLTGQLPTALVSRVSATAEDYESDREAERQRIQDMLSDVEASMKENKKSDAVTSTSVSSISTEVTISQATGVTSSLSVSSRGSTSTASSLLTTQTSSLGTGFTLPTVTSSSRAPAAGMGLTAAPTSLSSASLLSSSASTVTTSTAKPDFTFKPVFGATGANTSTTTAVTSPVSSTAVTGFNPIFPTAPAPSTTTSSASATAASSAPTNNPQAKPNFSFGLTTTASSIPRSTPQGLLSSTTSSQNYNYQTQSVPLNFSNAPAKTDDQILKINPLSTSTPVSALGSGFSLTGTGGFLLGQTAPAAPSTSSSNAQGLPTPNFSFGQQSVPTTGGVTFGSSSVAKTQASNTSAPSTIAFGTSLSSSTATPAGFQFGQNNPSSTIAASSFQFGHTNITTPSTQPPPYNFAVQQAPANTAQTNTTSSTFTFGSKPATTTSASSMFENSATSAFGTGSGKPQASAFGSGTAPTPAFGSGTTQAPMFGSGTPAAPAFGSGTAPAPAFGSGTAPAPGFGSGTAPAPGFGSGTAQAPGFGSGTAPAPGFGSGKPPVQAFGTATTSAPTFGSGSSAFGTGTSFGSGSASGTTPFGGGNAPTALAFGSTGSAPAFGSATNTGFGAGSSATPVLTKANTFAFGSKPAQSQPGFGSGNQVFGSSQPPTNPPAFGASSSSQDQNKANVFGNSAGQSGFNFGSSSASFSGFGAATTPVKTQGGGFQFGQNSGTPSNQGGEAKGFNFTASLSGTPQFSFGTPTTPATPVFGTPPNNNMFSVTGAGGVPPKPRVAARGSRRRGARR